MQIRERRGAAPQNVVGVRVGWMRAGDLLWCWECGVVACGGGATLKGQNSSTAVDSAQLLSFMLIEIQADILVIS